MRQNFGVFKVGADKYLPTTLITKDAVAEFVKDAIGDDLRTLPVCYDEQSERWRVFDDAVTKMRQTTHSIMALEGDEAHVRNSYATARVMD